MKKILKIIGITLGVIILLLVVSPFLFQSQIKSAVKNYINDNVNAIVEFDDVGLSLISSFPKAEVTISNLSITNKAPFENETLASAKYISFAIPFKELFKTAEEPIIINRVDVDELLLVIKTNALGQVNYDIIKSDASEDLSKGGDKNTTSGGFSFNIQDYSLNNSAITYIDQTSNTSLYLTEVNHTGNGTFSEQISEIDTETQAHISYSMDNTMYLSNNIIKLDALIDVDLTQDKYTFKENKGFINALPLEFSGYVKLNEDDSQEVDISFENPESSFKDFLALIPDTYSQNLDNVNTSGDFKVKGLIKGNISETTIPTLDINISSNNASFKYPDLPKGVSNIVIDMQLKNETGFTKDTYINISNLQFKIDEDQFNGNALLKNITENMLVDAYINGRLNLANISKAYPLKSMENISGILKMNLRTNFDVNALQNNVYSRIKNNGSAELSNFVYSSKDIVNPIAIKNAEINFTPELVTLKSFNASSGKTDLNATGTLKNLIGFLVGSGDLQGQFNVNSNNFYVSDFMVESANETSTKPNETQTGNAESLKIPAFLDCTINANAKTVFYDNITLKDVKGQLILKDEKAALNNMSSDVFGGNLSLSGVVDTKQTTPTFSMKLNAANFNLSNTFEQLALLQNLAPIAKALEGKLNTDIVLQGNLDNSFSPQLNSISGDVLAELFGTKVNAQQADLLTRLGSNLSFIDFSKLNLDKVKTTLSFDNGLVHVKPFKIKYQDIGITIGGSHGFDKQINYDLVFDVPAKYLGSDVNRLIGSINNNEVNTISIPVKANVTGTFTQPKISTDLSSSVSNLTKQLIEIQKQALLNKGGQEFSKLLKGLTSGSNTDATTAKDSTATKQNDTLETKTETEKTINNVFNNLFGEKKKTGNN